MAQKDKSQGFFIFFSCFYRKKDKKSLFSIFSSIKNIKKEKIIVTPKFRGDYM